ncbi:organic cation transporter protein-like isoform X1 [Macrobrachium rosenbergii]|uniref:organic cation transporter protein-like isoform X1 n=1 Tax=Macrobrachium rosenbergii TaxID=79674 RepID=UPI0034D59E59
MEFKTFDDLLDTIGVGRWTLFMFSSYILWALQIPYFSMGGAFYNPKVDHWCHVPELQNSSWTEEQKLNYSIPWEDRGGQLQRSQCRAFVRDYEQVANQEWSPAFMTTPEEASNLETRSCSEWDYDTSTFNSTVTMEWDLVCDRASMSPFFQSFYFFGIAVGEPLFGVLSDKYGRRMVLITSAVGFVVTATSSALVPLYSLVLAGRFILGMIHSIIGPAYIQGIEVTPKKYRTVIGLLSTVPFAITGMLFGTWAYFIRDWRTLQLVCTVPITFLLLQIPFLDESPRWLILQGRLKEAARTLKRGARWQGVTIPPHDELMNLLQSFERQNNQPLRVEEYTAEEQRGFLSKVWRELTALVRTPTLRRITIGLFGCWFCVGLTYWGMSLSGTTYTNDPFLYMIMSSLMEVPGYTGFTPVVSRFGRRSVLAFNFSVCAAAILMILATPASYTWMVFTLALVGKLFITGSYGILYLTTSELFPTCVRSRGLSLSSVMARLGSIVSPFIIKVLANSYYWAPSVAFGACAALGSGFALVIPESGNKPLADTVEELEKIYNRSRSSSAGSIEIKGLIQPSAKSDSGASNAV